MNGVEMGRKAGYSPLGRSEIAKDHTIRVTDIAWANLEIMARAVGMSRSAFIDAIGLGNFEIVPINPPVLGDSETPLIPPEDLII